MSSDLPSDLPSDLDDARVRAAIDAIDAVNAADPTRVATTGGDRPKELVHAETMTRWVGRLDPAADALQLIAARAHHLRRWAVPRSSYPEGRSGYLRWRTAQKKRHADEVATILREVGFDDGEIARVQTIIRKEGLGTDPAVQTHEDALCLVFLELQFVDELANWGPEKATGIVRKTAAKMSPAGLDLVGEIGLPTDALTFLGDALGA